MKDQAFAYSLLQRIHSPSHIRALYWKLGHLPNHCCREFILLDILGPSLERLGICLLTAPGNSSSLAYWSILLKDRTFIYLLLQIIHPLCHIRELLWKIRHLPTHCSREFIILAILWHFIGNMAFTYSLLQRIHPPGHIMETFRGHSERDSVHHLRPILSVVPNPATLRTHAVHLYPKICEWIIMFWSHSYHWLGKNARFGRVLGRVGKN